jgi:viroplasmin and RNaseH domain-containing protein
MIFKEYAMAYKYNKKRKVAYVVTNGHETGIFFTWKETEPLVKSFPDRKYKGYFTMEEAEDAWEDHLASIEEVEDSSDDGRYLEIEDIELG